MSRFFEYPLEIPQYTSETDTWDVVNFPDKQTFIKYVEGQFKIPGEYNLKNTDKWREMAIQYTKSCRRPNLEGGFYTRFIEGTSGYNKFWIGERDKCKKGVIFDGVYIPGLYYFYLNYCPFMDDVRGKKAFALVWDGDLYFYHYLLLCILKGKHCGVLKARQRGYQIPYSEDILTDTGFRPMGSLKVGDKVMTHTNSYANITEIFEHPNSDVYLVKLMDGREVRCGLEHLWSVYDKHAKKDKVLMLKDLINIGISNPVNNGKNVAYRFALPDIMAIEKDKQDLPIDPYVLGCLLGDGTIKHQLKIASIDQEILDNISERLGDDYILVRDKSNCNWNINVKDCFNNDNQAKYNKVHGGIRTNPLIEELKLLNLWGCNVETKFIPDIYLNSSIEQRLELLRGLMDTDGYISDEGNMEFKNCAPGIVKGIEDVLRSLGIAVNIKKFPPQKPEDRPYYRVYIRTNKYNLFKLSRKASKFLPSKKIYTRTPIIDIVKLDYKEDSRCIMIDSDEKIFLMKDYVPTHNSLKIMGILYWSYVWFEGTINTVGAIDETKVKKSWLFLERYKAHCDKNTGNAFRRGPFKPKMLDWIERIELKDGGYVGNDSVLKGVTFKQSPEQGVGGAQTFFFYEEAGVAPTMLTTVGYIRPALEKGNLTTGTIICSGALGELDDAEDLKEIFYNPEEHNFYGITNIWDKSTDRQGKQCTLFVSEAYNLEGVDDDTGESFYDSNGNSNVELALKFINAQKEKLKGSNKAAKLVQLDISQKITSPEEGFAQRTTGFFPTGIAKMQEDRLIVKHPKLINCELFENRDGEIEFRHVDTLPITEFPFKGKEDLDKRGCIQILELPQMEKGDTEPTARMYFAGIDPIMTDTTTTSESLFCIYIFKNRTQIKYRDEESGEIRIKYDGYKPVAWYIGRYDDRKQTNAQAEYLLRMYNAYALVENNVTSFIDHMRAKNLDAKYLMPSSEAKNIWGADVEVETSVQRMYGIYMAPNGKLRSLIMNKIKDYIQDVLDVVRIGEDKVVKTTYGVERIQDIGMIKEILGYKKGMNTDRLVAFGLVLSICEMYINSGIISEFDEMDNKESDYVKLKPTKGFFRRMKF